MERLNRSTLTILVYFFIWSIWRASGQHMGPSDQPEAYLNGSSYIRLTTTISLKKQTGFSFRTCTGGELLSQQLNDNLIKITVNSEGLTFVGKTAGKQIDEFIPGNYINNKWHVVSLVYRLGNLTLRLDNTLKLLANASYRSELLTSPSLYNEGAVLIVGKHYNGCILEGPSVIFNKSIITPHNVLFGKCPISDDSCTVRPYVKMPRTRDYCETEPCMMHGECVNQEQGYACKCSPRYTGKNCEVDMGPPCEKNPPVCKNGATCSDDISGYYKCTCLPGFTGKQCETELKTHILCNPNPCSNNGNCQVTEDENKVECVCLPGFSGYKCEKNINECQSSPCKNGGVCSDGQNSFSCDCADTGYAGPTCEEDVNECLGPNKPCQNKGLCFNDYGTYTCECAPGFDGLNCEKKINECKSHPCQNHGTCEEKLGEFECHCLPGFGGQVCELELRKAVCDSSFCGPHADCKEKSGVPTCTCKPEYMGHYPNCVTSACSKNPCLNGGVCSLFQGTYNCSCPSGYTGARCDRLESCEWRPCENGGSCRDDRCECDRGFVGEFCEYEVNCSDEPCLNAVYCKDYHGGYYCSCEAGWTGANCDVNVNECVNEPCLNGATCIDLLDSFKCQCAPGFSGERCQININDCLKMPCQNGGTCVDTLNGYFCNCTEQWMGATCERPYNACELKPCLHDGNCISKGMHDYTCKCAKGYEGKSCETNINDCTDVVCPPGKVCVDLVASYECECPPGRTGDTCNIDIDPCLLNPCKNQGVCSLNKKDHNFTCFCPTGYEGPRCELDINECETAEAICNHGICVNKEGTFQCYCMPGYTGERCNLDFDECLSQPCKNNAKCINKVNNYECVCPPGYEGKDCNINIDECNSNPCQDGSTCVDGVNEYSCVCQAGLTGKQCEININDCESSPCQNGAKCIDGLNMYTCDCADTGYKGDHCQQNIDDCVGNPCQNGAKCIDEVKNYKCECFDGYAGKNCEEDINECEGNPCQHSGICLQKSNVTLYNAGGYSNKINLPSVFQKKFDYSDAAGYECLCVSGVVGANCEININECESSPCMPGVGTCIDKIGEYYCECEEGFEGQQCQIDIDECEKYQPCVHGSCIDKRANYACDCEPGYGGKNCSVELIGCHKNPCHNNGTCKPYLDNETLHKFNCTCSHGFHGHTCDKITTMSLSGNSLVVVNTTRDEGHDIQFRFKTTLGDGFLVLGKGSTYYILSLAKGRLNLHSSLLNKWDGVFVGSNLNDSNWQRVFVAINSSHLVLSANDEQTIYPINQNDNNGFSTSFPTTFIGGYPNNHRKLTHGQPFLVGCIEDVIVNGEWVLPALVGQNSSWIRFNDIVGGCHREPQCTPNPCHSGGHCTDLWSNFSCTCERPYLGFTCQYNYTAATFGNENISDSLVTVAVADAARKAVRSIVDISMFIRTRQSRGQIFYLGSALGSVNLQNETYIAAQLEGGELLVRIQFNGTLEAYTVGGVKLNNGYNHLIEVIRNVTLVQVKLNGTEYFRKTISATGTLDAQVLFLGGQPQLRPVRQTSEAVKTEIPPSTGPAAVTTPLSMIHFKGIIQDVQISDGSKIMVVEFFPLQAKELSIPMPFGNVSFDNFTVLEGVISDDSCRSTPCHHHGVCVVTWNDYRCQCPRGFKGKDCLELVFCDLETCPSGSKCKNLDYTHECVANATFDGETPPLLYNLTVLPDSTRLFKADEIEVMYRTRSWGTALFAKYGHNYFVIFIRQEFVIVEWSIGGTRVTKTFSKEKFVGDWVVVYFKYKDGVFKGGFKEHVLEELQDFTVNDFNFDDFNDIFAKGIIYLAGSDNGTYDYWTAKNFNYYTTYVTLSDTTTLDSVSSNSVDIPDVPKPLYKFDRNKETDLFKGCLGEIHIGRLLLPYYTFEEIYTKQKPEEYFQLLPDYKHTIGCRLCYDKDCYNEGTCADPNVTYRCNCPKGFDGDDCSIDIDECEFNKCENNATCIDQIGQYTCACVFGFEGKYCEEEINECESSPCHHGGTCTDLLGNFRCECPEEYVGKQCEALRLITCDNQPCKDGSTCENGKNEFTQNNFTCICAEGMKGTLCDAPYCSLKNESCNNGGTCNTTAVPHCQCLPGFEGKYCETNINECLLANGQSPCLNGGICIDGINEYGCNCNGTGYKGLNCEEDINECESIINVCGIADIAYCTNVPGSYRCACLNKKCGLLCDLANPCDVSPCGFGTCIPDCTDQPDYICQCDSGWGGKNCTESEVQAAHNSDGLNILYIVVPIIIVILLGLAMGLAVLVNVARSKRATRGTYSPSAQEFCNPRVELDHVLKPPPEERLI